MSGGQASPVGDAARTPTRSVSKALSGRSLRHRPLGGSFGASPAGILIKFGWTGYTNSRIRSFKIHSGRKPDRTRI
ncbi:MAG: hypothetical protein KME30_23885 [Iphinoe sp. HA4291-MV1]|jgi:hypothetical protein|nr:hypothetical protein [Iphinoe sp. HA4291-MV1]